MGIQLLSFIKKWINIALKKLGVNFIFSKLIALVGFITWIGFVFYSLDQGWPGLTIINLLDLKSLLIVLFIASTVVFFLSLALVAPLIVYLNCKGRFFNTLLWFPYTKTRIAAKEICLLYSIYYCFICERWIKNFPFLTKYIIFTILIIITYINRKKISKEETEDFYLKKILRLTFLFFSLSLFYRIFLLLRKQDSTLGINWENLGLWVVWFFHFLCPLFVLVDQRWGLSPLEYFNKISLKKVNLLLFFSGVFLICYSWPGSVSFFITQTLHILKIKETLP